MSTQNRRKFLVISNIVISVLAAAAIITCFILPLWRVEFSASFTAELGEALKNVVYKEDYKSGGIRLTSAEKNGDKEISDLLPDIFSKSGKDVFNSFVDAVCDSGLSISFSLSFSSAEMTGALYDRDPGRAVGMIDKSVDNFIENAENIISEFILTAIKVAAEQVVKTTVEEMLKSNRENESYDSFINEIGENKDRIESLIDRIIEAIMDENATVSSVTEVVLDSADEAQQILLNTDRFSESAKSYDDDVKESVKQSTIQILENFADENGKLNFKETLVKMLLDAANQAIESVQAQQDDALPVNGMAATTGAKTESTVKEAEEKLKTEIKKAVLNAGDGAAAKLVVGVMATVGALLAIFLFMLFYPILRTLTNIGMENPGFNMFLPVFGGISAYTLLVILPSILPAALKVIALNGKAFSVPAEISAALNAVTLRFSSGTVVAFVFALALFVFSFFYDHQRRALKKELAAEKTEESAKKTEQIQ